MSIGDQEQSRHLPGEAIGGRIGQEEEKCLEHIVPQRQLSRACGIRMAGYN